MGGALWAALFFLAGSVYGSILALLSEHPLMRPRPIGYRPRRTANRRVKPSGPSPVVVATVSVPINKTVRLDKGTRR